MLKKIAMVLFLSFSYGHCGSSSAKKIMPVEPVSACLMNRYSGRTYDSSKSITQNQIQTLIAAAQSAPSCYNDQPWNFIFCNKETDPEAYQKALGCLVEFNQNWAKNAPLLVIAVSGNKFHHNQNPNRWGDYDTGAAAMSLCIQATAMGLMAHQMGGFDQEKISKEFQIPQEFNPIAVIAVGYEEKGKEDHSKRSERLPAKENFFKGKWGTP